MNAPTRLKEKFSCGGLCAYPFTRFLRLVAILVVGLGGTILYCDTWRSLLGMGLCRGIRLDLLCLP